jgi:hypothetical protein
MLRKPRGKSARRNNRAEDPATAKNAFERVLPFGILCQAKRHMAPFGLLSPWDAMGEAGRVPGILGTR